MREYTLWYHGVWESPAINYFFTDGLQIQIFVFQIKWLKHSKPCHKQIQIFYMCALTNWRFATHRFSANTHHVCVSDIVETAGYDCCHYNGLILSIPVNKAKADQDMPCYRELGSQQKNYPQAHFHACLVPESHVLCNLHTTGGDVNEKVTF